MSTGKAEKQRLIKELEEENVLLKSSLIDKQNQQDEYAQQITILQGKLAKAEEELDASKFNNTRLTKRVENLMAQLKTPSPTPLGWLSPTSIYHSVFGSTPVSGKEYELLQKELENIKIHLAAQIAEREKLQSLLASEKSEHEKDFLELTKIREESSKISNATIEKIKKRKTKIAKQRKKLEEMELHNMLLEQQIKEITQKNQKDHEDWKELEKKYHEKIKELTDSISSLIEGNTPNPQNNSINGEEGIKSLETVEDEICKLQATLEKKVQEYKVLEKSQIEKPQIKAKDGEISIKTAEESLKVNECPFKVQKKTLEQQLEAANGKNKILEKKEKLLDRLLKTSFKCPTCYNGLVLSNCISGGAIPQQPQQINFK